MIRRLATVVVALVCVAGAYATATTSSDPLYPMVSPTGSKLAWVEASTSRIWVANPDGSSARVFGPSFAANGIGQVAWTRYGIVVNSNFTLFRLSASGKRTELGIVGDQWFSVGGRRAAVGSGRSTGPVTVVDLLTGKIARVGSPSQFNNEPSLSPDGRRVAWWAGPSGGVSTAQVAGGAIRKLAAGGSCPAWSPDGRSIAYLTIGNRGQDLRVIGAAGGRSRLLAARAGGCGTFSWSPDSKSIAFTPQRIAIVKLATGRVTRSPGLGRVVGGGLAWSRDGSELYAPARPLAAEKALDNCTNLWQLDTKSLTGRVIVRGCP